MRRIIRIINLAILITAAAAGCSKKDSTQFLFISDSKVKIMKEPRISSEFIAYAGQNEMIDYSEVTVINKESWYKVKSGKVEGYIKSSYKTDERFKAFEPLIPEEGGFITVSQVNIFNDPSYITQSFFTMEPGEFFRILARDRESDNFYYIKTDKGKTGFLGWSQTFVRGPVEAMNEIKKNKIQQIKSWVEITSDKPVFQNIPGDKGRPVTEDDKAGCGHSLSRYPGKGEYAPALDKVTINGVTYYHVWKMFMYPGECDGGINGWVSDKDAMEIPDFYKYSSGRTKTVIDKKLLDFINEKIGGNLNVGSVKIKIVSLGNIMSSAQFYKVKCEQGYIEPANYLLVAREKDTLKLLHSAKDEYLAYSDRWNNERDGYLAIKDIDGDGKSELVEFLGDYDGETGLRVHSFKNGEYKVVLDFVVSSFNSFAVDDWDNIDLRHIVFFRGGYSVGDKKSELPEDFKYPMPPFKNEFSGRDIRVLEFRNGEYAEVDSSKTGLDYNAFFEKAWPAYE